jgi:hypothetical protein
MVDEEDPVIPIARLMPLLYSGSNELATHREDRTERETLVFLSAAVRISHACLSRVTVVGKFLRSV